MGCGDDEHGHAHGEGAHHSHGEEEHGHAHGEGEHAHGHGEGHDHSEAHPTGHDHHAEGHGHGDETVVVFTIWSDAFEVFGEHSAAVAGEKVDFLLHVTALDDFSALTEGTVSLTLTGPAKLSASASKPQRPGIYELSLTPTKAGRYEGSLEVSGQRSGTVTGLHFTVHESAEKAEAAAPSEDDEGRIEFLKEQQWGVPFNTSFAERGSLVASVDVSGRIDTPPGGSARVSPPVSGRVEPAPKGFVRPGSEIKKGELLGWLVPNPSSAEEATRAKLLVAEAQARVAAADAAQARAERLFADGATSKRALEDAKREAQVAQAALCTAREVSSFGAGAQGSKRWPLKAPIGGTVTAVTAIPGAVVAPGKELFSIVDTSELWVVAKVPEQDATRLRTDRPAEFRLVGSERWRTLDVQSEAGEAQAKVTVGRTVDARTRTVDVIYAMADPASDLRVGALVRLHIPAGNDVSGVVVPASAVIDQEGRMLVYVQLDGEHFEERMVRVGARAGSRVVLTHGLSENERVVTEGAHLVRLAARANSGAAHGHIH